MYDLEYYENLLRIYSATAEEICRRRWQLLFDNVKPLVRVLDYGSGVGWFRAWRPPGVQVFSFDIGLYPQTGVPLQLYDVVCFWDVLEHVRDFSDLEAVLALSNHVACTVPLVSRKGLTGWKHFKPGEHLHYFTKDSLDALFHKYGFTKCIIFTDIECPPREDVYSLVYGR